MAPKSKPPKKLKQTKLTKLFAPQHDDSSVHLSSGSAAQDVVVAKAAVEDGDDMTSPTPKDSQEGRSLAQLARVSAKKMRTKEKKEKRKSNGRTKRKSKQTKLTKASFKESRRTGNAKKMTEEDNGDPAESEEAARKKLVGLLMKTFAKACGSAELARSQGIEDALYSVTQSLGASAWREYRLRARSIIFNLRAADGVLLKRVRDEELSPEDLVRLGAEELASDTLKAERLEERERYFKNEIHVTDRIPKRKRDTHHARNAAPETSIGDNAVPNDYSIDIRRGGSDATVDVIPERRVAPLMPPEHDKSSTSSTAHVTRTRPNEQDDSVDDVSDESSSDDSDSDDSDISDDSDGDDSSLSEQEEPSNLGAFSTPPRPTTTAGDEELARALEELSDSSSSSSSSESASLDAVLTTVRGADLTTLTQMGFDSEKANAALQSVNGDLRKAVSYLCEA